MPLELGLLVEELPAGRQRIGAHAVEELLRLRLLRRGQSELFPQLKDVLGAGVAVPVGGQRHAEAFAALDGLALLVEAGVVGGLGRLVLAGQRGRA